MLSASQGVYAARQQFNCVPPRRSTFKGTPKCTKALRGEQHKWLDLKAASPPPSLSLSLSSQVALHLELEMLSDILWYCKVAQTSYLAHGQQLLTVF